MKWAIILQPIGVLYVRYMKRALDCAKKDGRVSLYEVRSLLLFALKSIPVAVRRGLKLDAVWAAIRRK